MGINNGKQMLIYQKNNNDNDNDNDNDRQKDKS